MATLPQYISTFKLTEVRISTLISDKKGDLNPTYEPSVQVPGSLTVTIQPQGESKELKGDSTTLEVFFIPNSTTVSFVGSVMALDPLMVILGGTIATTGTTPDVTHTYTMFGENQQTPYFRIQGRFDGLGSQVPKGGNAIFTIYKCRATEMPQIEISDASGDPGQFTFSASAVMSASNKKVWNLAINEVAKELD